MPGEKHGYDLVTNLPLGHGLTVLIASEEQHGEQIPAVLPTQPPLRNDPRDELIDSPERSTVAHVAGNRDAIRDKDRPAQSAGDLGHQYVGRLFDVDDIALDAGPKQGFCGDLQSERHDLGVNIYPLTGLPTLDHRSGVTDHDCTVTCQPLAAEGRCVQAPLSLPVLAGRGQETSAEDGAHIAPEESILGEAAMISNQHVLDVVGIVHQQRGPDTEAEWHQIAISASALS